MLLQRLVVSRLRLWLALGVRLRVCRIRRGSLAWPTVWCAIVRIVDGVGALTMVLLLIGRHRRDLAIGRSRRRLLALLSRKEPAHILLFVVTWLCA